MTQVRGDFDIRTNQVKNHVIHKGVAFPVSPTPQQGQIFYRTDLDQGFFYNGVSWIAIGTGAGGGMNKFSQQFIAQTNITITHNLADDNPVVQVYDSTGEQITPDVIDVIDTNNVNLQFNTATTGFVIIHGGTPTGTPTGGVGVFLHNQAVGATTWTVVHNLNDLNPIVQTFDSAGNFIEPVTVDIITSNNLQVTFGSAITGKVRVLAGVFSGGTGAGTFLPTVDCLFDLGSATFKWKDVHLCGSIFLGVLVSDPGSPATGQIWFNSTTAQFKGYNGTATILLG